MKHIFVVDDEKSIRDILKKYIENEGDKVTLFDNGSSVLPEITRMKPDLLVRGPDRDRMVLDTKWKLLDESKANPSGKYDLSQHDFYQLQSYGLSYLEGKGDVALVYPRTSAFDAPLPVFEFPRQTRSSWATSFDNTTVWTFQWQ